MRKPPASPQSPESASGGRSSGPCWFLGRPLPTAQIQSREPQGLCVPPGRKPPPPARQLPAPRAPPLRARAGGDSQLVRDPSPEKPHQR